METNTTGTKNKRHPIEHFPLFLTFVTIKDRNALLFSANTLEACKTMVEDITPLTLYALMQEEIYREFFKIVPEDVMTSEVTFTIVKESAYSMQVLMTKDATLEELRKK